MTTQLWPRFPWSLLYLLVNEEESAFKIGIVEVHTISRIQLPIRSIMERNSETGFRDGLVLFLFECRVHVLYSLGVKIGVSP